MAITVVIADDQEMVRAGFRMILETRPDIEVLADVVDGEAALEAVERLRPDVLLLDIRMPGLDGLEVTRRLCGRDAHQGAHPDPERGAGAGAPGDGYCPRIVIVTTFDHDAYVHTALHNGASGFLLKDASPALLVEAVQAAAAGDSLISPAITVRLLQDLKDRAGKDASGSSGPGSGPGSGPDSGAGPSSSGPRQPDPPLTDREQEIVQHVAKGSTNAEIAAELFLSLSTVKAHLANVQTKLEARNRVEIAAWAWETGVVRA